MNSRTFLVRSLRWICGNRRGRCSTHSRTDYSKKTQGSCYQGSHIVSLIIIGQVKASDEIAAARISGGGGEIR